MKYTSKYCIKLLWKTLTQLIEQAIWWINMIKGVVNLRGWRRQVKYDTWFISKKKKKTILPQSEVCGKSPPVWGGSQILRRPFMELTLHTHCFCTILLGKICIVWNFLDIFCWCWWWWWRERAETEIEFVGNFLLSFPLLVHCFPRCC